MPKELSITVGAAKKRWQIVEHTPRVPDPANPATWQLHVAWFMATVIDGVELVDARQHHQHWFAGQDVVDAMADATTRVAAYLAASNSQALYLGIRDALYALLQAKGLIPAGAQEPAA